MSIRIVIHLIAALLVFNVECQTTQDDFGNTKRMIKKPVKGMFSSLVILTTICNFTEQTSQSEFARFWNNDFASRLESCSKKFITFQKQRTLVVKHHIPCKIITKSGELITTTTVNKTNHKELMHVLMEYTLNELQQSGINVSLYTYQLLKLPVNPFKLSWDGLAVLQCTGQNCWSWYDSKNLNAGLYLHEIGHNFGLDHAKTPSDEYGDTNCVMGQTTARCFNAPHMYALGWSEPTAQYQLSQEKTVASIEFKKNDEYVILNTMIFAQRVGRKTVNLYMVYPNTTTIMVQKLEKQGDVFVFRIANQPISHTQSNAKIMVYISNVTNDIISLQAIYLNDKSEEFGAAVRHCNSSTSYVSDLWFLVVVLACACVFGFII